MKINYKILALTTTGFIALNFLLSFLLNGTWEFERSGAAVSLIFCLYMSLKEK